jgi:hypothetical protein
MSAQLGGSPHPATDVCHIRVRFIRPHLELHYQDERSVAHRFAAEAERFGAAVTVDDNLRDDFPPLPCRRLWT